MIPTSEKDYLDTDSKIRGQNFTCVSFLSPEELIKKKEHFYLEKFLNSFSKSLSELFNEFEVHYPEKLDQIRIFKENNEVYFKPSEIHTHFKAFVSSSREKLDQEFGSENNFQTNVRGLKIRGTYDTLEEAQQRADLLRKMDDQKFNIYIAEVGCWVPWNPNPDEVGDQEFAETQLNTLMKSYLENTENKNSMFMERKNELMKKIEEDNTKSIETNVIVTEEEEEQQTTEEKKDPWLSSKEN
jgi:hypothetical protein